MQLRRAAKFRKFTIIARRSIASIIPVPGRISYSLEDVYLDTSIVRRSTFSDLRASKSETIMIAYDSYDTYDTNDNDSSTNDLNVAEKSMKVLNITAEDVMDARARIQERSYWNEQDATAEIPETMEEVVAEHSLDKDEEEINPFMVNESTTTNYVKDKMSYPLRKQDILQFPLIARELKDNGNGTISDVKKKNIPTKKQEDGISSTKKITSDKEKSGMNPSDSHRATKFTNKESKKFSKILQGSSSKNAKETKIKSYTSLMKLKEKLELEENRCCIPIGIKVDQRRYYANKEKLMSADSSENNKEYCKSSDTSSSHHKKNVRSIDINNKIINHDVDKRKLVPCTLMPDISDTNAQKDKFHEYSFAFRYSKYHLMKPSQEFGACSERSKELTWGSISLGQTAHPSGYDRNNTAVTNRSPVSQKDVQTEPSNNSLMLRGLRRITQMQDAQPSDLPSAYNITTSKTNNYSRHEEMVQLQTLRSLNDPVLLENEKEAKARKKRNFSQNRISIEDRKAIELRALKAYNKLTLMKDKKELEIRKKRDSSLMNQQSMKESETSEMKFLRSYNDLTLSEDRKEMETTRECNLLLNCKSSEETSSLRNHIGLTSSEESREMEIRRRYNLLKHEMSAKHADTPTSISDYSSEVNQEESTISSEGIRQISSIRSFDMNDRDARRVQVSLNLREITRNIEWTPHETPTSRGIVLTNKNLQCQFSEEDEFCESQQRDIVDDNIASALHEALFCRPEIARLFHVAQRIGEFFFPNVSAFWQDSFSNDFVCQVGNEGNEAARYQNSLVDFNLEHLRTARNLGGVSDNINDNRVSRQHNRDLCMIFIDREQVENKSDTAIIEDSTTESWEDARSNIADVRTTSATNDNLSLQFIINVLKNFGTEVSERDTDVALSVEEHGLEEHEDVNNRILNKDLGTSTIGDVYLNEENNNVDEVLVNQSADIDDMLDNPFKPTLDMNDNSNDEDVASSVNSLDTSHKLQIEKYLSTIDIRFEEKIHRNTALKSVDSNMTLPDNFGSNNDELEFGALINTNERNYFLRNPSDSSLFEAFDYYAAKPNDEEFQKLTLSLADEVPLGNQGKSKLNHAIGNAISHFQNVEILRLETIEQDNEESNDEANDVYEMAIGFTTEQSSKTYSGEIIRQDDSYDTTYEGDSNSEMPISLQEGSLMEEFSNDAISLKTTSHTSVKISA